MPNTGKNSLECHDRTWPTPDRSWLMRMSWHDLLFMHWPVDFVTLRSLIPEQLEIDTFDGKPWIGIVPFRMTDVAPGFVPGIPWMSRFPELNVRTYVVHDGKPGVWFFSLEATNPVAVRGARWLFHLKYMDARIEFSRRDEWIHYKCRRTHRGEAEAELDVEYRPIGLPYIAEAGTIEHWLTSRYCLYAANSSGDVFRGDIDHAPWQLRDAQAITNLNSMTDGIGLELPDDSPLLHFSDRTDVVAWSLEKL